MANGMWRFGAFRCGECDVPWVWLGPAGTEPPDECERCGSDLVVPLPIPEPR